MSDLLDRLADKFLVGDGCWEWTGAISGAGYGQFWWDGRLQGAHRVVYELLVGPIPKGLELDHVKANGCTHTNCVRPDHLEPVTRSVNNLRGASASALNARKTHCAQGHPFDEKNTHIKKTGSRHCRQCAVVWTRNYRRKLKEQAA